MVKLGREVERPAILVFVPYAWKSELSSLGSEMLVSESMIGLDKSKGFWSQERAIRRR